MSEHTVLFVCLGNICRSPLAEGLFREAVERRGLTDRFLIDSCGTSGWHVGEGPDPRSVEVARDHGVDISRQRSRQLAPGDYQRFQWLVAMDQSNEETMLSRAPGDSQARVVRFTSYVSGEAPRDVPDPYYGGDGGFEVVYRLLERGCDALIDAVLADGAPES
ncbi:MAG: low molecular weight protein-tyrosine-phosphatase [Myxococcota bacterium]|nr:low molecular weight protein-tyrosine-phosphatase [Myxococcota bacterium]